jgi:hypothetical protein
MQAEQVRDFQEEALLLRRQIVTMVSRGAPSSQSKGPDDQDQFPTTLTPPLAPAVLVATEKEREMAARCAELQSENTFLRSRVAETSERIKESAIENAKVRVCLSVCLSLYLPLPHSYSRYPPSTSTHSLVHPSTSCATRPERASSACRRCSQRRPRASTSCSRAGGVVATNSRCARQWTLR